MFMTIKSKVLHLLEQGDLNGLNPWRLLKSVRAVPGFAADLNRYSAKNRHPAFQVTLRNLWPMLHDRQAGAGTVGGHYFHQDLWAAKKIFERRPDKHLDVGSRIDGFVAHLLVFMPVTIVDIRPLDAHIEGLSFIRDDASDLANVEVDSVNSLSSLHAAEHFGLGRYGDPVDPDACFRFMSNLQRVLAPSGRLYFSVPVGRERIEFNAHRVFGIQTILHAFSQLRLVSFAFIGDDGCLYENIDPATAPDSNYACGLFEFTKPGC
jgi:hypothetical protein